MGDRLVPLEPAADAARLVRRDVDRDARRRRDPAPDRARDDAPALLASSRRRSIFGWFYLVTFGSLVGYTAYVWLLDNAPLGTVATYAYVNPVVAIALGAIVLHESLTWTIGVGAVLVLACVAVVVAASSPGRSDRQVAPSTRSQFR